MDDMQKPIDTNGHSDTGKPAADETFGWTDEEQHTGNDPRAAAERMLGQLQSMIDSIATQAAPVVRQVGAKAAELAAVAADRAGPLAHRAADATADASVKIAERSRTLAADLRNRAAGANGNDDPEAASRSSVAVEGADDAAERSAQDDPAEGSRG
jgi:hypothetical protein